MSLFAWWKIKPWTLFITVSFFIFSMMSHVDGLQLEFLKDIAVHDNNLQFLPALSTTKAGLGATPHHVCTSATLRGYLHCVISNSFHSSLWNCAHWLHMHWRYAPPIFSRFESICQRRRSRPDFDFVNL
jgi:hypothetical protein